MYYNTNLPRGLIKLSNDRSYDGFTVFPTNNSSYDGFTVLPANLKPTSAAIGAAQSQAASSAMDAAQSQASKVTRDSVVKQLTDPGVAGKVLGESTGITRHVGTALGHGLTLAALAAGGYGIYKMLNRNKAAPSPYMGLTYDPSNLQSLWQQQRDPNSPSEATDPIGLAEKYGPNAATAALTAAALYGGYKAYKKYNRPSPDSDDDY